MIKDAKAGDVIFELDYDERYKTCKITEHVVSRIQYSPRSHICVNYNQEAIIPSKAFKTYKQAHRAYVSYLKSDLEYAKRDVDLITDILEGLKRK